MDEKEKIFVAILESHKGILYKVATTYCTDTSSRDDLMQEMTLQIWQSMDHYNQEYKWSTWIYRIALNTAISFYRKNKTRTEKTVVLNPIVEMPNSQDELPNEKHLLLLKKFIQALKELDRGLMLLHLEGLTSKEIADIIGITPTNVTTKISRIKKQLKIKFQNHLTIQNRE